MLLEHLLLSQNESAARVWRARERTEHEAAALFDALARDLAASGAPAHLVALARRCASDERDHALRCRAIVKALDPALALLTPDPAPAIGTESSAARRALQASVAIGCITESLSTAVLIAIRPHVMHELVRATVDRVLEDEVRHARLGWAYLAWCASREDVRWIAPHVPAMLAEALAGESAPGGGDLRAWGVLDAAASERVCRATIDTTILPGLARYGIVP